MDFDGGAAAEGDTHAEGARGGIVEVGAGGERCILDVAMCEGDGGSHSARHTIGMLSSGISSS